MIKKPIDRGLTKIPGEDPERRGAKRFYATLLNSVTCPCGEPKKRRQVFCRLCYFALVPEQQKALYSRIGEGFEAAYMQAYASLMRIGRIKHEAR